MKISRINTICLVVALLGTTTSAWADSYKHTELFCADDIDIETSAEKAETKIAMSDLKPNMTIGEPMLPCKYVTFNIPTYCNNLRVNVISHNKDKSYTLDYPVKLFADYYTNCEPVVLEGYEPRQYTKKKGCPDVRIVDEYFMDGDQHRVCIGITPFDYCSTDNTVDFYNEIEFILEYEMCSESEMAFRPIHRAEDTEINIGKNIGIVGNDIRTEKVSLSPNLVASESSSDFHHYVILVPECLKSGTENLRIWKSQKGYNVIVETYENIYNDSKYKVGNNAGCFDKESSVREWLRDKYAAVGKFYCLLIGDYRISSYYPTLNLGSGSNIKISSLSTISSDNGIELSDNAYLRLESDEKVILKNDQVKNSCTLEISSPETILDKGFSITKGAKMTIKYCK